ncbi:hypothetical protein ACHAXN_001766 [Cyclotella atomus]
MNRLLLQCSCCCVMQLVGGMTAFSPSYTGCVSTTHKAFKSTAVLYDVKKFRARWNSGALYSSTTDNVRCTNQTADRSDSSLLLWKDILPITLFTTGCLVVAMFVSTYEDYDVTHVRPNPSTLRRPTSASSVHYLGAATKGMGWGKSERTMDNTMTEFEEWYGPSALTLQWKPSYNEIMLEHRLERVPRWVNEEGTSMQPARSYSVEEFHRAVLELYNCLDELDKLKLIADDYQWEEIRTTLSPDNMQSSIRNTLEYSMDVLKYIPISNNNPQERDGDLPSVIGFDWGSCAWRHCGAKADGQEALAELYSSVGMLEPFECRFVIDIIERSIREVLAAVPNELLPEQNGTPMHVKPYVPYVSQADLEADGIGGIEAEYAQILSDLRVDLSQPEQ